MKIYLNINFQKNLKYILNRYVSNPFYNYKIYKVTIFNRTVLFVIRMIEIKKQKF